MLLLLFVRLAVLLDAELSGALRPWSHVAQKQEVRSRRLMYTLGKCDALSRLGFFFSPFSLDSFFLSPLLPFFVLVCSLLSISVPVVLDSEFFFLASSLLSFTHSLLHHSSVPSFLPRFIFLPPFFLDSLIHSSIRSSFLSSYRSLFLSDHPPFGIRHLASSKYTVHLLFCLCRCEEKMFCRSVGSSKFPGVF